MRVQAAYAASLFPAGPVVVTGLGFRGDGGSSAAGKTAEIEVRLSTMPWSVTGLQARFAANPGADEQVVRARAPLALPAWSASPGPAPFSVRVPLDRSFAYDPSVGALLLEVTVFTQAPGAYPLDASHLCRSSVLAFGPPGCGTGPLQATVATTPVLWGSDVHVQLGGAPPWASVGLVLGTRESGAWNGWTLPLDLGPIGAPGCHLSTDVSMLVPAAADASGAASFRIRVPSLPSLQTQWIRYQALAVDRGANALGVVTSQAEKVDVCGWDPVARVFAPGATPSSGAREIGVAPVLELTVR